MQISHMANETNNVRFKVFASFIFGLIDEYYTDNLVEYSTVSCIITGEF